jgi:peptide-methionine (S)-S-oxide reductase
MKTKQEKALFAAGCFWGVEKIFAKTPGVIDTRVGYSGGQMLNPTYEQVLTHATGHAETVEVTFDPARVSYEKLLEVFWDLHDPTTVDRQGPDVGSNYRSAIFFLDEGQKQAALKSREKLEKSGCYEKPIVTEIVKAGKFWPAEEYHQKHLR